MVTKLRVGHAYRMVERAYTRKSKFKNKAFIKAVPGHKIARFNMGNDKKKFEYRLDLISKGTLQLRQNAIEAARQQVNRRLQEKLGNQDYYLIVRVYPHQIQREHKTGGQKADRAMKGMRQGFGKAVNIAAVIKEGKEIFSAFVNENNIETAKLALREAAPKLPYKVEVAITKIA